MKPLDKFYKHLELILDLKTTYYFNRWHDQMINKQQPVARNSFMTPSMNGGKLEGVKRRINAFYRH